MFEPAAHRKRWASHGLWAVVGVIAVAAAIATMASLLRTFRTRTLDYAEGDVLFDASRIRDHLPLYFDPVRGALEYGAVPSRHFVAYVPTFAWALAQLPAPMAVPIGRLVSLAAWTCALAWIALRAQRQFRITAAAGAVFVFGAYTITTFAAFARPDGVAVAITGISLAEAVRRGRVGFWGGAGFALGAWLKPNVFGAMAGALAAELVVHRARALWCFLGATALSLPIAFALQRASGGMWIAHLLGSTGSPLRWDVFANRCETRLAFFGPPNALAMWTAGRAFRRKSPGSLHGLLALGMSAFLAFVLQAKVGGSDNYWMEPCLAGLVVVANFPLPIEPKFAFALAALIQVLWIDLVTFRHSREDYDRAAAQSRFIKRVRASCSGLVLTNTPGLDMEINGRVLFAPISLRYLAKAGRFSAAEWARTVRAPEIVCALTNIAIADPLELGQADADLPLVREALLERFVLAEHEADLWFYSARP
jgi:hypothetical protein